MASEFETVIGLEVHIQLKTESKIFCSASAHFGDGPNENIDPLSFGLPGSLPVMNEQALSFAVMLGLATHCKIAKDSVFARKHYFYPDLPKGYQISQFDKPICHTGYLRIENADSARNIGIGRIHLEEDAGKSIHNPASVRSFVDLNRSGVPLLEVVTQPDLRGPKEAVAFLKKLRQIARFLGISDGNMEEGSLRCDANISLRPRGSLKFGTRTEIKNLNSFKFVERAIEYEVARHIAVLKSGEEIQQETRLFDSAAGSTRAMRGKEESADYRYFPEPDLPRLEFSDKLITEVQSKMPALPDEELERLKKNFGLSAYDAEVLCAEPEILNYFDAVCKRGAKPKLVSNWMSSELFGLLNHAGLGFEKNPVSVEHFAELLSLLGSEAISGKIAKKVLQTCFESGQSPKAIVDKEGLKQIQDPKQIEEWIKTVLSENPEQVAEYKGGKQKVFGFFVGSVMKLSKGKASPELVGKALRAELGEADEGN